MTRRKNKKENRMKVLRSSILFVCVCVCVFSVFAFPKDSSGKFIQAFIIRHGGSSVTAGDEILLAKYDLINVNRFHYDDIGGDTWATIKKINPNAKIFLYQGARANDDQDNEPVVFLRALGRWNIDRGHPMGTLNTDNAHLFLLDSSSNRISVPAFPMSWNMDVGDSDYQVYWLKATIDDIVGRDWQADGVFVDTVGPRRVGMSSVPVKYGSDNAWASAMQSFLNAITVGMGNQSQKIWGNTEYMRTQHDYDSYINLDNSPKPPYAVLNEGAFAVEWGTGDVQFYPEADWKRQVDLMSQIHNCKLCYQSHSDLDAGESGIDNYGKPVTFWDILWYAMGSYHVGKNTVDNNSYFGFTELYNRVTWYDEYDHIDLGRAIAKYKITNYSGNNIYWREFEKGYVYVNPTRYDVSSISLPKTCKQLTHNNFKNDPATIPSINTINLKTHRAAILLKSTYDEVETPSAPTDLQITHSN